MLVLHIFLLFFHAVYVIWFFFFKAEDALRFPCGTGVQPFALRLALRPCRILAREDAARPQRAIERFVDETGHLGLIRDVEAGIEVRLQRKLAEQRQAEGVDGADGNLVDAVAQLTPAGRRNLAALSRRAECRDN